MDVRYHFVSILKKRFGASFLSGESILMLDLKLLQFFSRIYVNKEHVETDLTIKASFKVGHILELTHLRITPLFVTRK